MKPPFAPEYLVKMKDDEHHIDLTFYLFVTGELKHKDVDIVEENGSYYVQVKAERYSFLGQKLGPNLTVNSKIR